MSILRDHQGVVPGTTTAYRVSTNPADKGKPDVLYYEDADGDGSYKPELTDAQRKIAEDFATKQFIGLIDHKEEKKSVGQVSEDISVAGLSKEKITKDSAEIGRQIGLLVSGTDDQKRAATSFLANQKTASGENVFDDITIDKSGKINFKGIKGENPYDLEGLHKKDAVMQIFSAFENAYGNGIDRDTYLKAALGKDAGASDVVYPKADEIYTRRPKKQKTTNKAEAGAGDLIF